MSKAASGQGAAPIGDEIPNMRAGPLAGVRVVDLTQTLAGPYCTMLLADLGAEVIKVESREHPDRGRSMPTVSVDGQSVYFACLNRNKRGIELDLKDEADREALLQLVAQADAVVENFQPGVTERLGLDFDRLREVNPRIVVCSITGFGPDRVGPCYDYLIQALVGTMSLTGEPDGPPCRYGVSVVDHVAGAFGALGILAGLRDVAQSGEARYVDVALFDTHLSMLSYIAADHLNGGQEPSRQPFSAHPYVVPSQLFQTNDGYVVVMPLADHMWQSLCATLGLDELARDPELANAAGRLQQRERVLGTVGAALSALSSADAVARLSAAGVPTAPVRTVAEALADPGLTDREMVVEAGGVRMLGNPIKISGHGSTRYERAPAFGEHTDEVLRELAYPNGHMSSA